MNSPFKWVLLCRMVPKVRALVVLPTQVVKQIYSTTRLLPFLTPGVHILSKNDLPPHFFFKWFYFHLFHLRRTIDKIEKSTSLCVIAMKVKLVKFSIVAGLFPTLTFNTFWSARRCPWNSKFNIERKKKIGIKNLNYEKNISNFPLCYPAHGFPQKISANLV